MWDWQRARVRLAGPAVAGLTAAVLLAGACQDQDSDRALVVGSLLPRTGYNANADWVMAAQLAADEIDQALDWAPYPDGLRIRWMSRNSASRPDLVRQYTRELVAAGAKIVTGEGSLSVLGNAENYTSDDPLETAMICASCTSPDINNSLARHDDPLVEQGLRDPEGWLFRTAPTATRQGAIAARKMASFGDRGDTNNDGFVKVVLLCTTDSECIGAQDEAAVAVRRKAALDTLTEQSAQPGVFQRLFESGPAKRHHRLRGRMLRQPGLSFRPHHRDLRGRAGHLRVPADRAIHPRRKPGVGQLARAGF